MIGLAVVGPTASGKSALAEALAVKYHAPVLSVDAMQVYTGMDIGTAKTPVNERQAPLELIDLVSPQTDFSVQLFQNAARQRVRALVDAQTPVIFCGGTGLYLNAVIDEMNFPSGEKTTQTRVYYETYAQEHGEQALHELLSERDPQSAALIHPHNVRRVVRALEMLDEGVSYARHHEGLHVRKSWMPCCLIGLDWPRELLYERINQRVDVMMEAGLLDEVKGLVDAGLTAELTGAQAIGYKELMEYLAGQTSLDQAVETIRLRTRHYAKRQLSWFKRDTRVQWIDMSSFNHTQTSAFDEVVAKAERLWKQADKELSSQRM